MVEAVKRGRILVVEDSPTQLEGLTFLLEEAGFSVLAASDGREALTLARTNLVDLVISDVIMPEMDGYALCKELRAAEELRHIPVILLTSLGDPRDVIQGLESGANNFICKPYEDSALLARVQNVLANQEIRKAAPSEMGITIVFAGQRFFVTADRLQILDLLLSTYENAVSRNAELLRARDELRDLNQQLELRVVERTAALAVEVMEHQKSKEREQRLNRVLRAIRNVNQLIVREKDPGRLIEQACQMLVETRGYRAAWIVLEDPGGRPSLIAGAGWGEVFDAFRESVREGSLPACWDRARATQKGLALIDPRQACPECPLWTAYGHDQAAVAQLRHGLRDLGTLGICIIDGTCIDDEESSIVLEVAGDLGLALHTIASDQARAETEQTLSAISTSALDAVVLNDAGGSIVYWNPAAQRMFGYSAIEVLGRNAHDLLMPERFRPQYEEGIAEFRRSGTGPAVGKAVELTARHKDGHEFPVEIALSSIAMRGERWASAIIRDVSERKRAEQALRESEQRYRRLVESSPDIIWSFSDKRGTLFASPRVEHVLGYPPEQLYGEPWLWYQSVHPEDQGRIRDAIAGFAAGRDVDVEYRVKDSSGRWQWLHDRSMGRRVEGSETIMEGISTLITRQKHAEEEREKLEEHLRASQKMDAIGRLAGGVAHDFNNLLSVILTYTGFAMEETPEGAPLREDLMEVKNAGDRAVTLVRQLLAFSRKQVLQPELLDLNQIAAGVEKMFRRILGEDIQFVQSLAPGLGVVRADRGQIEQVLMNLVVNARDAMPGGGRLTIETANSELDEEYAGSHVGVRAGPYVLLSVTDTGSGMDEQTRRRIFEPFFTTKEKGKGTGLGLSMVYGIVKQSGGSIWVYSEPGHGTTFKVYLPRELSATAPIVSGPTPPPRSCLGTETVLVVEDEPALRKVARRALRAAGYTVLAAEDGDEALLIGAQHAGEIHLLLTDVIMPRMSGRVLATELTQKRPALKVLFMSGYADNAIVNHGVLDPGTPFLSKPFTASDLTQKVREVLDAGETSVAEEQRDGKPTGEGIEAQPLAKADVRALPPELLDQLRHAVVAVRYDEALEIVERIRATRPELANGLRQMVELFDYQGMRDLLAP